jgi:small subunit ribosomal protein S18
VDGSSKFRRKKVFRFCVGKIDDIDYKDIKLLHGFVAERGKISASEATAAPYPAY